MPAAGPRTAGTVAAYAAAVVAFAYALVSLYWAVGGHRLVSTVGGYVAHFARQGGAVPVVLALAATAAKVAGGLLALALVSVRGSIHYLVLPGLRRADLLDRPQVPADPGADVPAWGRVVTAP